MSYLKSIPLNSEVKKYLTKKNIFSLAEIFSLKSVFGKDFISHFKFKEKKNQSENTKKMFTKILSSSCSNMLAAEFIKTNCFPKFRLGCDKLAFYSKLGKHLPTSGRQMSTFPTF